MREVAPSDIIFSFVDTRIIAVGVAQSFCWESPKPFEFGFAGQYWENIGWKVLVAFTSLAHRLRPKDHIGTLRPVLPNRYSPLTQEGNGLQSIYLTEIPAEMAEVLIGLIGYECQALLTGVTVSPSTVQKSDDLDYWEHRLEQSVVDDESISETDRQAIVRARCGQGLFKQRVMQIEHRCRITGVEKTIHLVASHCKPWRDSTNEERLDGENGLLLTPNIDHLFDRGFIGFEDDGTLIIAPVAHKPSLQRMGIEVQRVINVGSFSKGQKHFLDFHRNSVVHHPKLRQQEPRFLIMDYRHSRQHG
jgi:hypothetical protein